MRGTFANIRLRNEIAGKELIGGLTVKFPEGEELPIYDAAMQYAEEVSVKAGDVEFTAKVRIDTPKEREYYKHGGILQFVLRQLMAGD